MSSAGTPLISESAGGRGSLAAVCVPVEQAPDRGPVGGDGGEAEVGEQQHLCPGGPSAVRGSSHRKDA